MCWPFAASTAASASFASGVPRAVLVIAAITQVSSTLAFGFVLFTIRSAGTVEAASRVSSDTVDCSCFLQEQSDPSIELLFSMNRCAWTKMAVNVVAEVNGATESFEASWRDG